MAKREQTAPKSRTRHYEKMLTAKAEEVRRSMSAARISQTVTRLDVPSDEGDLSQQSHEEWIFLNRNSLEIKLLREVQHALRRIREGSFGVCQRCEQPISAKRLDAIPWAKYCVSCQEQIALAAELGTEEAVEEAE
jgi:DnaK suppressor protein